MDKKLAISFLFFIFCLFISYPVFSQYEFIENKGQWHQNVQFKMPLNSGALFLESNSLTYTFVRSEDLHFSPTHHESEDTPKQLVKNAHAYRVNFLKSNPKPDIIPDLKSNDYCNYFIGNDQSRWASEVRKFSVVKYYDLYDSIDLEYLINDNALKYNFIVRKGGNVRDIELEYEGVDEVYQENGDIIIKTSINTVTELKPYAFQIIRGDTIPVPCSFNLKRNKLKFDLGNYNKDYELIIDPYLVFSTYSGSVGDNWGFTATWDYDDNVFAGGVVFEVGYPISMGAYQMNFAGGTPALPEATTYTNGCDIGLIKFNSDGTQMIYSTYLGGAEGQEMPHSLIVTEKNELIIMGTTGSSDFPTSSNAFQTTFAGGQNVVYDNVIGFGNGVDIFVSKLSEDGKQLLASTFVGGANNDGLNFKQYYNIPPASGINHVIHFGNDSIYANYADGARGEVVVDKRSYVYVGTNTFSEDFPSGINPGYQTSSAGKQEGVVFKLNPDFSQMVWSTYIGGTEDDAIFSISLSEKEDVIVAGTTVSTDFPTSPGAYSTTFNGGNTDGFVVKLNNMGNQLLASSYFGSDKFDNIHFVRTDKNDNIFICGQTRAEGMTLVHNAEYYIANSGQFIAKLNPSLKELVWSTVFGTGNGRPNISISAFDIDVCNRVYLTGWGREWTNSFYNPEGEYYTWDDPGFGTKGMQTTADAFQSQTDGQDFYMLVLKEDASALEYASFFGELHELTCTSSGRDHVDGGTSRFDKKGSIIQSVCASCGGCQTFPTYPNNVWSSSNMSSNCNNAVFKFRIIESLAIANFDPVPAGCVPYTVNFHNNSEAISYQWDFGDGNSSTEENPSHTYTQGGQYLVSLTVYQPNSCNERDTITRVVTVIEPGVSSLPDIIICENQSVIIGPEIDYPDGFTFSWVGPALNNPNIKNPVASPTEDAEYILTISGICNDELHQKVIISDENIEIEISPDITVCKDSPTSLSASNIAGKVDVWEWSTDIEFNNIISNEQTIVVSPSETSTYYVKAKESLCGRFQIAQVTLSVYEFNYSLKPSIIICPGETTNLTIVNNNESEVLTYQWSPVSEIISGENTNSPLVGPSITTIYYVTIINSLGCETTDQTEVVVDHLNISISEVIHNLCYGDCKGEISVIAEGFPPYSYQWSNGELTNHLTGLCAGKYELTVTDSSNCVSVISVDVLQPDELQVNFEDVIHPLCDGIGFGKAKAIASGGVPPYEYLWSYMGGNEQTNNSCLAGDNFVTVTDANNCEKVGKITLKEASDFSSTLTTEMVKCFSVCEGSASVQLTNGKAPFKYNWSNGESGESVSNLCAGSYMLSVVGADNCVAHNYFEITEPPKLIVNIFNKDKISCFGEKGSLSLTAEGGTAPYTYLWSNGGVEDEILDIKAGSYTVSVTDANNCEESASFVLTEPQKLSMKPLVLNMKCTGVCNGAIYPNPVGGVGQYTYLWSDGSSSETLENLCLGTYSLLITDENSCQENREFSIKNLEYIPDLEVDSNTDIVFLGEPVFLAALSSSEGMYQWDNQEYLNNPTIPNPIALINEDVLFHVVFTDEYGCVAIDSINIRVRDVVCGEPYVFLPNAFTPNDDKKNDFFKPYFPPALVTEIHFVVYDRWGKQIYESKDLGMKGWDGKYNDEKLATDVFVYFLKVRCLNGEEYSHKGNVTLLK